MAALMSQAPDMDGPVSLPPSQQSNQSADRELSKRFEVQKLLGQGSYGKVFRCRRYSDGKIYAVKEVDVRRMSALERCDIVNEIRLLASIQHVNVCRYYEAFVDGHYLCIVMEFCPNGDLSRFIKKGAENRKAFPEAVIWKYFVEICLGLFVLHSNRILHRDIKAANLFVGENDTVKLGDLGIAKLLSGDGAAKTTIGTPHYMPPELWLNRPYGPPADLWALGCLLYELMTYTVPFDGSSVADLKAKVTSGQFRPLVPGRYSQELIGLMSGLLSLNPARRPGLIAIFSMPQAQERLAALPSGQLSLLPPAIMKTIQVPADLRLLSAYLPPATY